MGTSIPFKHAILRGTAGAALAGLFAMAGSAGAAAGTAPASHRGRPAQQARLTARHHAAGFSNWPMFRDGPAHLGVSPETAIGTATASTLTAGWTAMVGTASYSSRRSGISRPNRGSTPPRRSAARPASRC